MMRRQPRPLVFAAACAVLLCACAAPAPDASAARQDTSAPPDSPAPRDTALAALERELARVAAEAGEGALVGVAAVHLESGERVALNGGEPFTMMSVYKFPIGIAVLRRVEAGGLRLDQPVRIAPADLRPGHSPLAERHPRGGVDVPLRELLRLMVAESDNTASDRLLRLAGGADSVTANLRRLGVTGVRVDREEGLMAVHYYGVGWTEARSPTRSELYGAIDTIPAARRREAAARFPLDPRDRATPDGMADLLIAFEQGRALGPETTRVLREMMVRTGTGLNRLKGLLPPGTEVAHKTGTSGDYEGVTAAVNDVGIVTLPGGRGRVAVAVFVRNGRGTQAAERVIARAARAVYDHWSPANGN